MPDRTFNFMKTTIGVDQETGRGYEIGADGVKRYSKTSQEILAKATISNDQIMMIGITPKTKPETNGVYYFRGQYRNQAIDDYIKVINPHEAFQFGSNVPLQLQDCVGEFYETYGITHSDTARRVAT